MLSFLLSTCQKEHIGPKNVHWKVFRNTFFPIWAGFSLPVLFELHLPCPEVNCNVEKRVMRKLLAIAQVFKILTTSCKDHSTGGVKLLCMREQLLYFFLANVPDKLIIFKHLSTVLSLVSWNLLSTRSEETPVQNFLAKSQKTSFFWTMSEHFFTDVNVPALYVLRM